MRADQLETGGGRTRAHLWNEACTRVQKLLEQRFLGLGLVHSTPQTHPGKLALASPSLCHEEQVGDAMHSSRRKLYGAM